MCVIVSGILESLHLHKSKIMFVEKISAETSFLFLNIKKSTPGKMAIYYLFNCVKKATESV